MNLSFKEYKIGQCGRDKAYQPCRHCISDTLAEEHCLQSQLCFHNLITNMHVQLYICSECMAWSAVSAGQPAFQAAST